MSGACKHHDPVCPYCSALMSGTNSVIASTWLYLHHLGICMRARLWEVYAFLHILLQNTNCMQIIALIISMATATKAMSVGKQVHDGAHIRFLRLLQTMPCGATQSPCAVSVTIQ